MHVIAGKAICFKEAMTERFQAYQRQVVANAKALADSLAGHGHHIISGGTDNHLMMIDLRKSDPDLTGKIAQISLDKAHITANKIRFPAKLAALPNQRHPLRHASCYQPRNARGANGADCASDSYRVASTQRLGRNCRSQNHCS